MSGPDVYLVISGDTGTIRALGPPDAVAAIEAVIAERDALKAERDYLIGLVRTYAPWELPR